MSLAQRSLYLLNNARFFTLASQNSDCTPWASTVNYVPLFAPLRLVWYSMRTAKHSENISLCAEVSGSLFRYDMQETSPLGLDGAQFTGIAREIPQSECKGIHQDYYRLNFPDVLERARWQLPLHEFYGDGLRRFYELLIKEWWLLDIDAWLQTKEDKRVPVPLNQLVVPKQEIL
ncbi:pyridoxamine 5'-phosphate oxidase family protein [Cedecea davisae]|uniref:pyridoxamine 5'-phosphate oxidase family protein n=1 Tax=Cedecea davisae TaxID=158484 RepID=UPI00242DA68F|nr:pyridoxamine 5'-phosphate oxidase family protein [Cedecea davisae]